MKFFTLAWFGVWIALIVGWVMNIIEVVHAIDLPVTGMFVFRIIGVFLIPLGGVLGIFF